MLLKAGSLPFSTGLNELFSKWQELLSIPNQEAQTVPQAPIVHCLSHSEDTRASQNSRNLRY